MRYYVVWRYKDGGFGSGDFLITEPIASIGVVMNAVRDSLNYWRRDEVQMIISYQPLSSRREDE